MANTLVDDRVGAVAEDADFIGAACEIFVIYFTEGADRQSLPHKNRFYVHFFSPEIRKVATTPSAVRVRERREKENQFPSETTLGPPRTVVIINHMGSKMRF